MPFRSARRILSFMTELDHIWSQLLETAASKADETQRKHVAEYLRLKASNDAIRELGVRWLFDTVIEIAGPAMSGQHPVTIEREDPHTFIRGTSKMVGSRLFIRQGVRCLTVEAGWARIPSDGIMQKGALAYARIEHFGMQEKGGEIRLVHGEDLPQWLDDTDNFIDIRGLQLHFDIFIGQ